MKYWSNVCVEGYCLTDEDADNNNPCGRHSPSPFCLSNGHCPHFAWSNTTERNVAHFVPLRLVVWDKFKIWFTEELYWTLRWWFWDCLWFNRRRVRKFFDSIPVVTAEDCPAIAEFEEEERKLTEKFPKWFKKALKENEIVV